MTSRFRSCCQFEADLELWPSITERTVADTNPSLAGWEKLLLVCNNLSRAAAVAVAVVVEVVVEEEQLQLGSFWHRPFLSFIILTHWTNGKILAVADHWQVDR